VSETALGPAVPHRLLRWEDAKALVINSVSSRHSKRAYARALEKFFQWVREQDTAGQGTAFGKALVQRYRAVLQEKGLAPSSINGCDNPNRRLETLRSG
jgi:hypothetical protein